MSITTKKKKLYKYVSVSRARLNFLIPYNSFQVIRLVPTFKIQNSKIFFVKKGDKTFKIIHILRYLQDTEFNITINRSLLICIIWKNNYFGLVIDKYQKRFYDFGGIIFQRSTPFLSSPLISGRFRFRGENFLILDPINLITES